jgi:hypothetical protein
LVPARGFWSEISARPTLSDGGPESVLGDGVPKDAKRRKCRSLAGMKAR